MSSRQLGQQHCLELPYDHDPELHHSVGHAHLISALTRLLTAVCDSVTNPTTQFQPLAIIAIQENFDCSLELTQQQDANLVPGSGYIVQLANPFNSTDVRAPNPPRNDHI